MFKVLFFSILLSVTFAIHAHDLKLYYVFISDLSPEEIMDNIALELAAKSLVYSGNIEYADYGIIQANFCNPKYGRPLRTKSKYKDAITAIFPCGTASVYEQGGKTHVALFAPTFLNYLVEAGDHGNTELMRVAKTSESDFMQVIANATETEIADHIEYAKNIPDNIEVISTMTLPESYQDPYKAAADLTALVKNHKSFIIKSNMTYKKKTIVQLNICYQPSLDYAVDNYGKKITALYPCEKISFFRKQNRVEMAQFNTDLLGHVLQDSTLLEESKVMQQKLNEIFASLF